ATPAIQELLVIVNLRQECVSVHPVDHSQRDRVRLPSITHSRARLSYPVLDQRLATPHRTVVTALQKRTSTPERVSKIVELIVPEMTFVASVPIDRRERQGSVEPRIAAIKKRFQPVINLIQRKSEMMEGGSNK